MFDPDSVFLTRDERRALRALKDGIQPKREIGNRLYRFNLVAWHYKENDPRGEYAIRPEGVAWLEHRSESRGDVHWTRVLSIAAILISLCALFLEFQGRGWFDWLTPGRTPSEQLSSVQSESPESTK